MWTIKEAEDFWKGVVTERDEEITELTNQIDYLKEALKTVSRLTSCDDTWDFVNRVLEGEKCLELPYRINRV